MTDSTEQCDLVWYCTREADHEGACADTVTLQSMFVPTGREQGPDVGPMEKWVRGLRALVEALAGTVEAHCSLRCPSRWRTADGPPPHDPACVAAREALRRAWR